MDSTRLVLSTPTCSLTEFLPVFCPKPHFDGFQIFYSLCVHGLRVHTAARQCRAPSYTIAFQCFYWFFFGYFDLISNYFR